jgi:hypothetical protein
MIWSVLIFYICFHYFSPSDYEPPDDESDEDEVSKMISVIGQK